MVRLGVTNDVDLAPLFFPLEAGWATTPPGLITSNGTLTELETSLLAEELDIAPISPLTYAQHQTTLYLLPFPVRAFDLASDALFLISKKRMDKYDKPKVAVPPGSAIGEVILKLIGRNFYSIEAEFQSVPSDIAALNALQSEADICILSGEPGMCAISPAKEKGYFVEDLSKAWWLLYELPLPLMLFGIRREWTGQEPEAAQLTRAIIQMFRSAIQSAKEQIPTLIAHAEKRTGLLEQALNDHYAAQRYEINSHHLRGLLEFYRRAASMGLIPTVADLNFFPLLGATPSGPASPPRRTIMEASSPRSSVPNSSHTRREQAEAQGLRVIKGGKNPDEVEDND
jgi:chorismate dehydratase